MTIEEAKAIIKKLQSDGCSDEQIVYSFSMMFLNKQINAGAYIALIDLLGYSFNIDFINMKEAEQVKFVKKLINMK